ncbi:hypothetical protein [Nonomuraea sp. NPDC003804]|uniref:hypothetical protein n=1 Tax=Nonomuraea sp. NPDC003804 TaxID=3154547 RepID=UPI0033AC330D
MSNTSVFDQPSITASLLPLTDRSANYMRDTIAHVETEIARMAEAEKHYQKEAAAARAIRELLTATRDRYMRELGDHAAPVVEQQVWPVDPSQVSDRVGVCPTCTQEMAWTEKHGFVHEIDGGWVAAGELCSQAATQHVGEGS